jgi:hypothetical protein
MSTNPNEQKVEAFKRLEERFFRAGWLDNTRINKISGLGRIELNETGALHMAALHKSWRSSGTNSPTSAAAFAVLFKSTCAALGDPPPDEQGFLLFLVERWKSAT